MLPFRDSRLAKVVTAIFFIIVIGYAYYEVRGMLYGPRIALPSGTTEVSERFVTLKGTADRIATLKMNGKAITVSEDGSFAEPYLLAPGLNRVVFDAEDKYGRDTQEVLQIVYTPSGEPEEPFPLPSSTTTPETATTTSENP